MLHRPRMDVIAECSRLQHLSVMPGNLRRRSQPTAHHSAAGCGADRGGGDDEHHRIYGEWESWRASIFHGTVAELRQGCYSSTRFG
jgi:hypothetical protein